MEHKEDPHQILCSVISFLIRATGSAVPVGMGLGPGFKEGASGWLAPSDFIMAHRGARAKQPLLPAVLNDANRKGWGTDY